MVDLGITIHQLPHLWVAGYHSSHYFWVAKHLLHHGIVEHLSDTVWVPHHLTGNDLKSVYCVLESKFNMVHRR